VEVYFLPESTDVINNLWQLINIRYHYWFYFQLVSSFAELCNGDQVFFFSKTHEMKHQTNTVKM